MARPPVTARIVAYLDEYDHATYRELAREAYDVDDPTAAQLSAVRRAVAKLAAAGEVERLGARMLFGESEGTHTRVRVDADGYETEWTYANPAGQVIRRKKRGQS